jgi:hypothetical protein
MVVTAMDCAMPTELAEAVRSMPCRACRADRGAYCPSDGSHLARWQLATAAGLLAERDLARATKLAHAAPPGLAPGLAVVPELSGVVCAAAGHPLRWATTGQPPHWTHASQEAGQACPAAVNPVPAHGEPCRYLRRHWLLSVPAVAVAGAVPACRRCARKQARRRRSR